MRGFRRESHIGERGPRVVALPRREVGLVADHCPAVPERSETVALLQVGPGENPMVGRASDKMRGLSVDIVAWRRGCKHLTERGTDERPRFVLRPVDRLLGPAARGVCGGGIERPVLVANDGVAAVFDADPPPAVVAAEERGVSAARDECLQPIVHLVREVFRVARAHDHAVRIEQVGFVVQVNERRPFHVDLEARQPLRQGLLPIRPLRPDVRRLADEGSSKAHAERPRPKAIAGAGRGVVGLTE